MNDSFCFLFQSNLLKQTRMIYENNVHQCHFCPMGFSNPRALERHLFQVHPQIPPNYLKMMTGASPAVTEKLKQMVGLAQVPPMPESSERMETSSRASKLMDKINNLQAMRLDKQIKNEPKSPSISGM